jgi:hypothetical protein
MPPFVDAHDTILMQSIPQRSFGDKLNISLFTMWFCGRVIWYTFEILRMQKHRIGGYSDMYHVPSYTMTDSSRYIFVYTL